MRRLEIEWKTNHQGVGTKGEKVPQISNSSRSFSAEREREREFEEDKRRALLREWIRRVIRLTRHQSKQKGIPTSRHKIKTFNIQGPATSLTIENSWKSDWIDTGEKRVDNLVHFSLDVCSHSRGRHRRWRSARRTETRKWCQHHSNRLKVATLLRWTDSSSFVWHVLYEHVKRVTIDNINHNTVNDPAAYWHAGIWFVNGQRVDISNPNPTWLTASSPLIRFGTGLQYINGLTGLNERPTVVSNSVDTQFSLGRERSFPVDSTATITTVYSRAGKWKEKINRKAYTFRKETNNTQHFVDTSRRPSFLLWSFFFPHSYFRIEQHLTNSKLTLPFNMLLPHGLLFCLFSLHFIFDSFRWLDKIHGLLNRRFE